MTSFFTDAANMLLNGMGTNLFAKSTQLIEGIAPLFMIGFSIYVMLVFWDSYRHGVEENFLHLCKKFFGWFIIIALAFNATEYQKLANILYTFPDQLSELFGKNTLAAGAMDVELNHMLGTGGKIWHYATNISALDVSNKLIAFGLGLAVLVFGILFLAITFSMYLVAKLCLAMVILTGPIFIGFMLFPATRQWGMNWIGQVLNYTITITLYVILGAIQQDLFNTHMSNLFEHGIGGVLEVIPVVCMLFVSTILYIAVALNIPHIASALTGGASISGHMHTLTRLAKLKMGLGGKGGGGGMKKD